MFSCLISSSEWLSVPVLALGEPVAMGLIPVEFVSGFFNSQDIDPDHKGFIRLRCLPTISRMLIFATIQAEESILNALVAAETMTGMHGNKVHALPRDQVRSLLRQAGARKRVQP